MIYDRCYSAMTSLTSGDIDLKQLFQNVDVFVVSGITVALNQTIQDIVVVMVKYCRGNHILVVYDSNYRAKLWSIEAAGQALKRILPYVDILSAGYLDAQNLLGILSQADTFEQRLEDVYGQMKALYPQLQYIVSTKRDICIMEHYIYLRLIILMILLIVLVGEMRLFQVFYMVYCNIKI